MPGKVLGHIGWSLKITEEGVREYDIEWLVEADGDDYGPLSALTASGLPDIGTAWQYGNEIDYSAVCTFDMSVEPVVTNEPGKYWIVKQKFSTEPFGEDSSGRGGASGDRHPMLEPPRVSGSFTQTTKEALFDRYEKPIRSISFEPLTGQILEFPVSRPVVNIGLNYMFSPVGMIASAIDKVNSVPMWGLPRRTVRLAGASWEVKYYQGYIRYYSVDYSFDINYDTFDVVVPSVGTKVLMPGGNINNPSHFIPATDPKTGEEKPSVFHKADGTEATSLEEVFKIKVEFYNEFNFFVLGIPLLL